MSDIVEYEGQPLLPDRSDEDSKWKKFLRWAVPWLRKKAIISDQFIEAELQNKHLQNEKLKAEAFKTYMESIKIKEEYEKTRLENIEKRRKLADDPEKFDQYEIEEIEKRLAENIKKLQLIKNGAILKVEVKGEQIEKKS